jgi:hypothetical protein
MFSRILANERPIVPAHHAGAEPEAINEARDSTASRRWFATRLRMYFASRSPSSA